MKRGQNAFHPDQIARSNGPDPRCAVWLANPRWWQVIGSLWLNGTRASSRHIAFCECEASGFFPNTVAAPSVDVASAAPALQRA